MTLYAAPAAVDAVIAVMERRHMNPPDTVDLDQDYFRSLTVPQQDAALRDFANDRPEVLQELFCDWAQWSKLFAAWEKTKPDELYRLFNETMRLALEQQINEKHAEDCR